MHSLQPRLNNGKGSHPSFFSPSLSLKAFKMYNTRPPLSELCRLTLPDPWLLTAWAPRPQSRSRVPRPQRSSRVPGHTLSELCRLTLLDLWLPTARAPRPQRLSRVPRLQSASRNYGKDPESSKYGKDEKSTHSHFYFLTNQASCPSARNQRCPLVNRSHQMQPFADFSNYGLDLMSTTNGKGLWSFLSPIPFVSSRN